MMAAPAAKPAAEPPRNPHAGAAAASPSVPSVAAAPILAPKGITVEKTGAAKEALDEAAELFRVIFKGDIVP